MEEKGSQDIIETMIKWGFPEFPHTGFNQQVIKNFRAVEIVVPKGKDLLTTKWYLGKDPVSKALELEEIGVLLQKEIAIPDMVEGVDMKDLERRIKSVDWEGDNRKLADQLGGRRRLNAYVGGILVKLAVMAESRSKEVRDACHLLSFKYFPRNNLLKFIPPGVLRSLEREHLRRISIDPGNSPFINVNQAYNVLDNRYALLPNNENGALGWATANLADRDIQDEPRLRWLRSNKNFDLTAAMHRAGIPDEVGRDARTIASLTYGDRLVLPIDRGGVTGKRVFFADPLNDRMSVDQKETARMGLYEDLGRGRSSGEGFGDEESRGRRR